MSALGQLLTWHLRSQKDRFASLSRLAPQQTSSSSEPSLRVRTVVDVVTENRARQQYRRHTLPDANGDWGPSHRSGAWRHWVDGKSPSNPSTALQPSEFVTPVVTPRPGVLSTRGISPAK